MLAVKSWFNLYKRRKKERDATPEELFIENCDMIFECPLKYNDLIPLNEKGNNFADSCVSCKY